MNDNNSSTHSQRSKISEYIAKPFFKVYLLATLLLVIAELTGVVRWTIAPRITIIFVAFFHTIYWAVAFAPQLLGRWIKIYSLEDSRWAAGIVVTACFPLLARYGVLVGPNVPQLIKAGAALILQEIGNNWGAIAIAMPIAILLGLRREVIGACYSVAREPNLGLIGDVYGIDSPEGRGVLGTYIVGTVLGTAFFSILASLTALLAPAVFHPISLGMACGIGSTSMMTACAATLGEALPEWKDQVLSFAIGSNMITNVTGLYASWLIGLPFAEWVYRVMGNKREKNTNMVEAIKAQEKKTVRPKINIGWTMFHVTFICIMTLIGNWILSGSIGAFKLDPTKMVNPIEALPGMLIIWLIVFVSVLLSYYVPVYVPTIAYIGTIGMLITIPGVPGATQIVSTVSKVGFMAFVTPIVAFTSLSIAKDIENFVKAGWRIIVAALITLISVYISAAIIAEIVLRIQHFPRIP